MYIERGYLQKLAKVKNPRWKPGMSNDEREKQCADYCSLRNLAGELLADVNNKFVYRRLSDLLIKLGLEEI